MTSRSEAFDAILTQATTTTPVGRITKKQRGRHKKLRKRALEDNEGCETTGIAVLADWQELIQLETLDPSLRFPVRPSVRKRRNHNKCQNAEGMDHRDIIYQALGRMNQSKKRSQNELSSAIPSWATLHNIAATQSLVVVELQLQDKWEPVLERLRILRPEALPVATRWFQGPRPKSITDALMYFSSSPPTASNKKLRNTNEEKEDQNLSHTNLLRPLLLTREERRKEGFPMVHSTTLLDQTLERHEFDQTLPALEQAKLIISQYQVPSILGEDATDLTFVKTRHQCQASQPRVIALDCEMVQTSEGTALARITLVQLDTIQEDGTIAYTVVLDELVKPSRPVLDYVTRYSGITAEMLNPVETRLEQIQAFLVQWLNKDDIIVGHSLENDFRAVQLIHDTVVDTSVVFRGTSRCRKYGTYYTIVGIA
jgi:Exonuclease